MKINQENQLQNVDISEIFSELQDEHRSVYIQQCDNQLFIYRPLGRSEFKMLIENDQLDDFQKEEILCQACVLWPEQFDFENCEAGIPTVLTKAILKNSFLDSIESRKAILLHFRQEMFDLDNQITCIINEAFPQFDIEEIEVWDIAKTAKYLSRAEWKLTNLRGMQMQFDPTDMMQGSQEENTQTEASEEQEVQTNKRGGEKKRLTPAELAELQRKYPEMQWGDNVFDEMSVEKLQDSVDVSSPALRPGI